MNLFSKIATIFSSRSHAAADKALMNDKNLGNYAIEQIDEKIKSAKTNAASILGQVNLVKADIVQTQKLINSYEDAMITFAEQGQEENIEKSAEKINKETADLEELYVRRATLIDGYEQVKSIIEELEDQRDNAKTEVQIAQTNASLATALNSVTTIVDDLNSGSTSSVIGKMKSSSSEALATAQAKRQMQKDTNGEDLLELANQAKSKKSSADLLAAAKAKREQASK